jgi:predicted nucleic acid-binding protein
VTPFVIDSSVALAWCFEDEVDTYADAVLDRLAEGTAIAPSLWLLEIVNVLVLAERRKRIHQADAARFLEVIRSLPITIEEATLAGAFQDVQSVARGTGLTAYDAAYVALALRTGLPLATRDAAVRAACASLGVPVLGVP